MIPKDNLRACREHEVVAPHETGCPVCQTDAEAAPKAASDRSFGDTDLRRRIEPQTLIDAIPRLIEDAERAGEGPVQVAVGEVSMETVRGAAGYTDQERWFNVIVIQVGNVSQQTLVREEQVEEALAAIEAGEGFVESPPDAAASLNDETGLKAVVAPYVSAVECDRVDETTLHVTIETPSDNAYKQARRELGVIAKRSDLSIRTLNAGGRWEQGKIELSAE
jgi:hypothetical protein